MGRSFWVLALVVAFAAGCKGHEASIVGTWEDSSRAVKFEFSSDKTFREFGPNSTTSGNWIVEGDTVKLSNLATNGKAVTEANKEQIDAIRRTNKPDEIEELNHKLNPTLAISDDRTTLTPDEANKQQIPVLHRSSADSPVQVSSSSAVSAVGTWDGEKGLSVFFNDHKTFLQNGQLPMTGHWTLSGKTVQVSIDKIGGHSVEDVAKALAKQSGRVASPKDIESTKKTLSHIEYKISDDGKSITQHAQGLPDVTFKRRIGG